MASKASMSGRPALSFCFTWMGYQCSFRPSSPSCCLRGAGEDGEDAAIHAHVAHLHLVRDAAKGDDGQFSNSNDGMMRSFSTVHLTIHPCLVSPLPGVLVAP